MADNQTYTFANLLEDLQKLTPEQLSQEAQTWGEHPMRKLRGVEVALEDYVAEDNEAWPVSDACENGELQEDDEVYVSKGTVWLDSE